MLLGAIGAAAAAAVTAAVAVGLRGYLASQGIETAEAVENAGVVYGSHHFACTDTKTIFLY